MQTVVLGRTGLAVSVAGLGCGGPSRLGQRSGASERESIRVVHRALELGVTYFDTAQAYGTEAIVGKALAGHRHEVVVSTKIEPWPDGRQGQPISREGIATAIKRSLTALNCDVLDVVHLHGVRPEQYDYCLAELVPELQRLQQAGLIGHLGVTESFQTDPGHEMLGRAVADNCFEVAMVAFNPLNPSARDRVFAGSQEKGIGIEVMMVIRGMFIDAGKLRQIVGSLIADGYVSSDDVDPDEPFGFLTQRDGGDSVIDAAYRFARHEPGTHVILVGTGNPRHLEENVRSINQGPLPDAALARLELVFGRLHHLAAA